MHKSSRGLERFVTEVDDDTAHGRVSRTSAKKSQEMFEAKGGWSDKVRAMDALISEVKDGKELDPRHAEAAVEFLLDEGADDLKKADFLRALSAKGETPGEIAAFVEAFLGALDFG